ncbi:MAG: hypothetical protein R3F30_08335 [Planctomycetota bacterium]
MIRFAPLLSLSLLATSLPAQVTVVTIPQGYAAKEGARSRHVPLDYCPARIQNGYGPNATGWTAPKVINELWARLDGTGYLTTAFSVDMQVLLSSNGCDPRTSSYTFKDNLGSDVKVFVKRRKFSFPSMSAPTTPPAKFSIQIKGDTSFVAIKPTLLVDWATYSTTNIVNTSFYVDATNLTYTTTGASGSVSYYGTACNPTDFYNYSTGYNEGEVFRCYGYTRNAGDWVLCWLGASQTALNLGGGCSLYTSPLLIGVLPTQTWSTTQMVNFHWGFVPTGMKGKTVFQQMAAFDSTFKTLRMSRGCQATFGDYKQVFPFTVSHRYGYGSGSTAFDPDKDDARYGWLGTAIIFEHR